MIGVIATWPLPQSRSTLSSLSPYHTPSWPAFPQACQEAALLYAQGGIPVFPVHGKVPFPRTKGFHDATTDSDVIGWW